MTSNERAALIAQHWAELWALPANKRRQRIEEILRGPVQDNVSLADLDRQLNEISAVALGV